MVNRGWVARPANGQPGPDISIGNACRTLHGRIGYLPRVGIRSRDAFADTDGWPKNALYPTVAELSSELGEELLPFVLLLSPAEENGFVRRWQPRESGSMMHYGYAFQWFAMAVAVLGLLFWNLRKRRK
jgi:surfeit locus 1 family protein